LNVERRALRHDGQCCPLCCMLVDDGVRELSSYSCLTCTRQRSLHVVMTSALHEAWFCLRHVYPLPLRLPISLFEASIVTEKTSRAPLWPNSPGVFCGQFATTCDSFQSRIASAQATPSCLGFASRRSTLTTLILNVTATATKPVLAGRRAQHGCTSCFGMSQVILASRFFNR